MPKMAEDFISMILGKHFFKKYGKKGWRAGCRAECDGEGVGVGFDGICTLNYAVLLRCTIVACAIVAHNLPI